MANYRTFYDLRNIIVNNIYIIPLDIDLIVGIPRSGIIPATLLALLLNKQVCDLNTYLSKKTWGTGKRGEKQNFEWSKIKKVLIIDDSIGSGNAINNVKKKVSEIGLNKLHNILYGCIYLAPSKSNLVDLFFEVVSLPRFFEWNIFHHSFIKNACLDIDGVLCKDPESFENDDDIKYIEFLLNAKPLFIPSIPIGCLVTSRLEKYRHYTEQWLELHNIEYNDLIMLDLPSKKERSKRGIHGKFKAETYLARDEQIFIESNKKQAEEIYERTKKDVFCVENNKLYSITNSKDSIDKYESLLIEKEKRIREIHSSLTWKVGHIILSPIKIIFNFFKKK